VGEAHWTTSKQDCHDASVNASIYAAFLLGMLIVDSPTADRYRQELLGRAEKARAGRSSITVRRRAIIKKYVVPAIKGSKRVKISTATMTKIRADIEKEGLPPVKNETIMKDVSLIHSGKED
jgi:hypothetical protein